MLDASIPLAWKQLLSSTLPSLSTTAVTSSSAVTSAGVKPMIAMASWGGREGMGAAMGCLGSGGGVVPPYLHGTEVGGIIHAGQH